MASILFDKKINLLLTATPSTDGFIIAYDLDGLLKQKDEFGVITPVGYNTAFPLNDVLALGNNTEDKHIILGTATSIASANGTTYLVLDEGSNEGHIKLKGDLGELSINNTLSGLSASSTLLIKNGQNFYQSILGGTQSISSVKGIELGIDQGDEVNISQNYISNVTSKITEKRPVFISTQGSEVQAGLSNVTILGGVNLLATQSNTVYLGNNVNINNAYNLPNTPGNNGEFLMTDGSGNAFWSNLSSANLTLEKVLEYGNNTGTYSIVLGTQSSIKSSYGNAAIFLSHLPTSIALSTDNGLMNTSYLVVRDSDIFIKANDYLTITASTAYISTSDNHGFQYTDSYDFLDLSLVTKEFVDSATASIWLELDQKATKKTYTINLVENIEYTLTHTLNTTDLGIQIYFELEKIELGVVEIMSSTQIKLKSSRSLNNVKVVLIG
jgi:hypothetical protein